MLLVLTRVCNCAVIEGLGAKQANPAEALAALDLTRELPLRKRYKFRLVKSRPGLEREETLLQELTRLDNARNDATFLLPWLQFWLQLQKQC